MTTKAKKSSIQTYTIERNHKYMQKRFSEMFAEIRRLSILVDFLSSQITNGHLMQRKGYELGYAEGAFDAIQRLGKPEEKKDNE